MNNTILDTTAVLNSGKIKFSQDINLDLHYHRQIEVLWLVEGSLKVYFDNKTISLNKFDLLVIQPFELHRIEKNGHYSCLLVILDDYVSMRLTSQNIRTKKFTNLNNDITSLLSLYSTFLNVSQEYSKNYFDIVSSIITNLYGFEKTDFQGNEVMDYIHNNLTMDINLQSVANACNSNRTYVSKIVNNTTGYHFNRYLNKIRIARFLDLYEKENNSSIENLALNSGFTSMRTFYRAFNEELNCSPNKYFNKK